MERICEYYENIGLPKMLIPKKLKDFGNNLDIKAEFEYWLENQEYIKDCVAVDGYTAKELAKTYPALDGEGAFCLLLQLRDDPGKAHKRISRGFMIK